MFHRSAVWLLVGLVFTGLAPAQSRPSASSQPAGSQHGITRPALTRPKIRTITAFVRFDRRSFSAQVQETLKMLRAARAEFTTAGYEIETIRITSQPFSDYVAGLSAAQALDFFHEYDGLAQKEGFTPDIGPAMVKDSDDPHQAELLAEVIGSTSSINGFVVVADDSGIHWNGLRAAAKVMKYLEEHTNRSEGNFRFAAGAFPPANAPFFPVSSTGEGRGFAIGMESAGVVQEAFAGAKDDWSAAADRLTGALSVQARQVEEIARRVEKQSGWKYRGIDLTPVPLKDVSIGAAMEDLLAGPIGSPGSLSVASIITSAVRRAPVQQTGYSGLMLPVLEDSVLAQRWESGAVSRDALLSYSSVCSTGLDAVPLPGDTTQRELENIIADVASLAVKWHKPLSTRLLPVAGKKAGEMTEFASPYLVNIRIR